MRHRKKKDSKASPKAAKPREDIVGIGSARIDDFVLRAATADPAREEHIPGFLFPGRGYDLYDARKPPFSDRERSEIESLSRTLSAEDVWKMLPFVFGDVPRVRITRIPPGFDDEWMGEYDSYSYFPSDDDSELSDFDFGGFTRGRQFGGRYQQRIRNCHSRVETLKEEIGKTRMRYAAWLLVRQWLMNPCEQSPDRIISLQNLCATRIAMRLFTTQFDSSEEIVCSIRDIIISCGATYHARATLLINRAAKECSTKLMPDACEKAIKDALYTIAIVGSVYRAAFTDDDEPAEPRMCRFPIWHLVATQTDECWAMTTFCKSPSPEMPFDLPKFSVASLAMLHMMCHDIIHKRSWACSNGACEVLCRIPELVRRHPLGPHVALPALTQTARYTFDRYSMRYLWKYVLPALNEILISGLSDAEYVQAQRSIEEAAERIICMPATDIDDFESEVSSWLSAGSLWQYSPELALLWDQRKTEDDTRVAEREAEDETRIAKRKAEDAERDTRRKTEDELRSTKRKVDRATLEQCKRQKLEPYAHGY